MEYFEYGQKEQPDLGFDVEDFLRVSQQQQEDRLEEELERIEQQLEERQKIFEDHQKNLESKLDWCLDRLEKAYKTTGDVEELKEKVTEFYELLREERLRHWRDKQELEQETEKEEKQEVLERLAKLDEKGVLERLGKNALKIHR